MTKTKPSQLTQKQKAELIKTYGHIPTQKEVFERIKASQERMLFALAKAWDSAPDDPKIKKQLINVIEKAAKFDKRLKDMMAKTNSAKKHSQTK